MTAKKHPRHTAIKIGRIKRDRARRESNWPLEAEWRADQLLRAEWLAGEIEVKKRQKFRKENPGIDPFTMLPWDDENRPLIQKKSFVDWVKDLFKG